MGYEVTCIESLFRVAKPRSALAALKEAHERRPFWKESEEVQEDLARATTLRAALEACGWDVECAGGRIEKLFYEGKLLTNFEEVERLFSVLPPYVRSGSFVHVEGEGGAKGELRFRGGKLRVHER
jgi:hypothetical protein